MYVRIPHLSRILKPRWAHKPGFGMRESYKLRERQGFEQATTPEDSRLLAKLGIKKKEKVLAIAAYYASWAYQLAKQGAKVDYSDISKEMVSWAKKEYGGLFGNYVCSNYELIPKNVGEYDWTFTFEACGGGSGLSLAYLRSLLNNKGGILVLFLDREKEQNMGSKPKKYPRILNTLVEVYDCQSKIMDVTFKGHRIGRSKTNLKHRVYILRTNNFARRKAELDLMVLSNLGNRRVVYLEKEANKLGLENKDLKGAFIRINKFSKSIKREFVKNLEVR